MNTRVFGRLLAAAAALMLFGAQASAELLRVTPLGVAVPDQTVTDPVPIGADGFRLTYHGGGDDPLQDPVMLILATPDGATPGLSLAGTNPGTLSVTATLGGNGGGAFGGTWNNATGFAGVYNATTGASDSVYDFIGFNPQGSASENYANWSGASGQTSWSLFVYTLTVDPDLNHGNWVEFNTTNLAPGSFVVGYGCNATCSNPGDVQSTPFTYAGLVSVPEPGTLSLLGMALVGLGLVRRRRSA